MPSPAPDAFDDRLRRCDPALYAGAFSATSTEDRRALLLLQSIVRREGDYVYLEIGSHLGGTLQPHCADPRCRRAYSIDKRTQATPDIRPMTIVYEQITGASMITGLRATWGDQVDKIVALDCDAQDVTVAQVQPAPRFCFIDGEHTIAAAQRDFASCLRWISPDGIIAFHDGNLIFGAFADCRRQLDEAGIRHRSFQLPGTVYAILLGASVERYSDELAAVAQAEKWYQLKAAILLPCHPFVIFLQLRWRNLIWWAIGCRNGFRRWKQSLRR
jgi:methyltransferase family protein